eukprot:scaffold177034_cov14-Prasinocladus_malaysianus.AAC.1
MQRMLFMTGGSCSKKCHDEKKSDVHYFSVFLFLSVFMMSCCKHELADMKQPLRVLAVCKRPNDH